MKKILGGFLLLVIVAACWVGYLLWSTGQFKAIEPHFAGNCKTIQGVPGPEDITIHPVTGVAYISACDRRALRAGQDARGAIYAYDLTASDPVPIRVTTGPAPDFQPHGISLFVDPGGKDALFVINHSGGTHKVEIYDLVADGLVHRKTVTGPALVSPNDIVAVSRDSFYVSNDHRYTSGIRKTLEDYLKLPLANIVYYDGRSFSEAAAGISYANGINVSPDGRNLYVAGTTRMTLKVYDRDLKTGALIFKENIKFDTGLDNIEIGPDGDLWIGAHPQLLKFVAHSKDAGKLSPSQVLRIKLKNDGQHQIDEVYLNRGETLSGSSVCAVYKNRLLIGSVFEEKFLDCRFDQ
jgi:arylesterase/paraoxonase